MSLIFPTFHALSTHAPGKYSEETIDHHVWTVSVGEDICYCKSDKHSFFTCAANVNIIAMIIKVYMSLKDKDSQIQDLQSALETQGDVLKKTRNKLYHATGALKEAKKSKTHSKNSPNDTNM